MNVLIHFVMVNSLVRCSGLMLESNETFDIDLFMEHAGYPRTGDIPLLNRKIIKGYRVTIPEHPYVASVRRQHSHYLTGALLTRNVVVTVAHPLVDVPIYELGVVVGESYADRGIALFTVVLVVLHEKFNPYTLQADIAMLRLYENVNDRVVAKSISMISRSLNLAGSLAFITGWGRCDITGTEPCLSRSSRYYPDEWFDPMLRTVTFTIDPWNYYCEGYTKHELRILEGMMCLGSAREEDPVVPCLAVPGAPLVVHARLVGLQSWGFGCGYQHDLPLIYTNITTYSGWIIQNTVKLRNIKQHNLTQLYKATKAYTISQWLIKTRVFKPPLQIHKDKNLEPIDVDKLLMELKGKVYDIRDFVSNGMYHNEKLDMFSSLMYARLHMNRLKMALQVYRAKTVPVQPFLSNLSFDGENLWNTSVSQDMNDSDADGTDGEYEDDDD